MRIGNGLPASLQSLLVGTIPGAQKTSTPSIGDLEKHLDDYKKGKGNLSLDTAAKLNASESNLTRSLSSFDPSALSQFGQYATAFSYSQRARFVSNVNELSQGISQVREAYKTNKIV
jgi:hypothetical protein